MKNGIPIISAPANAMPEPSLPGLLLKQAPSQRTFYEYLYGENKIYSLLMIFLMIVQFIIFKLLYPYPDFFSDSYSYIFAAYAHLNVNIWPIGYSKFLLLFHWFTHSATALNFFQYMFLGGASLYFYHTIVYFYPTGKNTRTVLCLFLFFNPLNLYLANYVSSDAIFVALSLIWLSQLIWVIHRPKPYQIIILSVVFFIAFTFRYNAMYYPIVAAVAFLMSRQKAWVKIAGVITGPILIIPFILFSSNAAKQMTGTAQFPPILGGWQWGNNALYMREYITEDSTKFPSPQTAELDAIARQYYRIVPPQYRELSSYVANFFIRQPEAPLKQYLVAHFGKKMNTDYDNVVAWGKVAPVFGQYGLYLIKRHPLAFARYYLLVNTKNYFLPPLEKLEIYNLGQDEIAPIAAFWFGFPNLKVTSVSKILQGNVLLLYPGLFMILNIYFGWNLYMFIRRKGFKMAERHFFYTVALISLFVLLNAGFSIFANIIVIRYQVFPMIVCLSFSLLLTDWLEQMAAARRAPGWNQKQPGQKELSQKLQPQLS